MGARHQLDRRGLAGQKRDPAASVHARGRPWSPVVARGRPCRRVGVSASSSSSSSSSSASRCDRRDSDADAFCAILVHTTTARRVRRCRQGTAVPTPTHKGAGVTHPPSSRTRRSSATSTQCATIPGGVSARSRKPRLHQRRAEHRHHVEPETERLARRNKHSFCSKGPRRRLNLQPKAVTWVHGLNWSVATFTW